MGTKKHPKAIGSLPQVEGEVWEVGRRALDISVTELERKGERPELLLAIRPDVPGGVVLADVITSHTPLQEFPDFVRRAMTKPLIGKPRRPEMIRVGSQAEADVLAKSLAAANVGLEVVPELKAVDMVAEHAGRMMGSGMSHDYRGRAAKAGEVLSEDGLRQLYAAAKEFYQRELWLDFDEEEIFEIELQYADQPGKTIYGIVMGSMEETFGLALYYSLQDLARLYEFGQEDFDKIADFFQPPGAEPSNPTELQQQAQAVQDVLSVSSVSLTYVTRKELSPALLEEIKELNLPLAKKSVFPLVLRTREGFLELGQPDDLRDMFSALKAILDWDDQISDMDVDDEVGVTLTTRLAPVAGFLPEAVAYTTLRENPVIPPVDDDLLLTNLAGSLETLLGELPEPRSRSTAAGKKKKVAPKTAQKALSPTSPRLYTLNVFLSQGPVSEEYGGQVISRKIEILGHQTLHDLHEAIFDAFDRWEEHLYEFNLGEGPRDRSEVYFFGGGWDAGEKSAGHPQTTTIDSLGLAAGRYFGYIFDMGDYWEHTVKVVDVKEGPTRGTFPRVIERVGASPPQYPDEDEEE